MGQCCSVHEDTYRISHHRYIAIMQSILPSFATNLLSELEEDIGHRIDDLYQRLLKGETRVTKSTNPLTTIEIYIYAGVIALYYGPHSEQCKTISDNLITYSNVDVKWLWVALEGLYTDISQPVSYSLTFNENDESILPEECTILLLADFATGLRRSTVVLEEARRIEPNVSCVIHGGDTYYSGSVQEQKEYLLEPIMGHFPNAMVRCLRGNHDLYSGPKGFQYVQDTIHQSSTYFSLSNSSLLIQGLDTSVFDDNPLLEGKTMVTLHDKEVAWHCDHVQKAKRDGKKIILFSHHEPITFNDKVGIIDGKEPPANISLYRQLHPIIPSIDAYYFGHQHGFMMYQDYTYRNGPTLKKPRMIGHGGCPVMSQTLDTMYQVSSYDTTNFDIPSLMPGDWKLGHNGSVIDTGFVLLRCKKGSIRAEYYNIHSTALETYEQAKCVYTEVI